MSLIGDPHQVFKGYSAMGKDMHFLFVITAASIGSSLAGGLMGSLMKWVGIPNRDALEQPLTLGSNPLGKIYTLPDLSFWAGKSSFGEAHRINHTLSNEYCLGDCEYQHCFKEVGRTFFVRNEGEYFSSNCKLSTCDYNATTKPHTGSLVSLRM